MSGDDATRARAVVEKMLAKDQYSAWLNLRVEHLSIGECTVAMEVREEMLNGFGVCHGGVSYALADSALAFASNSSGRVAMVVQAAMQYPQSVQLGETIRATANEVSRTNRLGFYEVKIETDSGRLVGVFNGTVYRTDAHHFEGSAG